MQTNSTLHTMPALVKIVFLFAFSILVFSLQNIISLLVLVAAMCGLVVWAKLPQKTLLSLLKTIVPFAVFFMVYYSIFQSWQLGVVLVLRLIIVVALASVVSATTSSLEFIDAIEKILSPLAKFKINYKNLTLGVWMALRFIPIIQQNFQEIRMAQQARGLHKNTFAILIPLLIKTLKTADAIGEAIEIRGLGEN